MKIQAIKNLPVLEKKYIDMFGSVKRLESFHSSNDVEKAIAYLDKQYEIVVKIHEENIPKLETNKAIYNNIKNMMTGYGIFATYDYKGKRKSAHYEADLLNIQITDDFNSRTKEYENHKISLERMLQQKRGEEQARERQKNLEEQIEANKRAAEVKRALLIVKRNFDHTYSWEQIYENLLKLDPVVTFYFFVKMASEEYRGFAENLSNFDASIVPNIFDMELIEKVKKIFKEKNKDSAALKYLVLDENFFVLDEKQLDIMADLELSYSMKPWEANFSY